MATPLQRAAQREAEAQRLPAEVLARRRVRARMAAGLPPNGMMPPGQAGIPASDTVIQQRMSGGQFGARTNPPREDSVPALVTPGERVLTPEENRAFEASPMAPAVLAVDGHPTPGAMIGDAVLRFAQGGVVPEVTPIVPPQPRLPGAIRLGTGQQYIPGRGFVLPRTATTPGPGTTPPTPPTPPPPTPTPTPTPTPPPAPTGPGYYTPQEIGQFLQSLYEQGPKPDQALIEKRVAAEDTRLANIRRAQMAGIASQYGAGGALDSRLLAQTGADLALQGARDVREYRLGLETEADKARQEAYRDVLSFVGQLFPQREQQAFTREERVGAQQFTADQNNLDRAHALALQDKKDAADLARLEADLAAAKARQDDQQAADLERQINDINQRRAESSQQNAQFYDSLGLDREKFEEMASEFDTTTAEGRRQFNESLKEEARRHDETLAQREKEFQATYGLSVRELEAKLDQFDRKLLQDEEFANLDANTRLAIANIDAQTRIAVENLDQPGMFEQITSGLTALATAYPWLRDILGSLGLGGLAGGGTGTAATAASGAAAGGALPILGVAAGAAMGYYGVKNLIEGFDTANVGQSMIGGLLLGGPIGAAVAGIAQVAGVGPSKERVRRDTYTKAIDDVLKKAVPEAGGGVPNQKSAWWIPENRAAIAAEFRQLVSEEMKPGHQGMDWERLAGLGLAAAVQTADGKSGGWILLDDPELIKRMPPRFGARGSEPPIIIIPNGDDAWAVSRQNAGSLANMVGNNQIAGLRVPKRGGGFHEFMGNQQNTLAWLGYGQDAPTEWQAAEEQPNA